MRHNYIVKLQMNDRELDGFKRMLPLVGMSMSPPEEDMVARILGYRNMQNLKESGFDKNPFLRNAFAVLSFLYVSRSDLVSFTDFWQRLFFTDKDVEKKVRRMFNMPSEVEGMSVERLESMYALDSTKEEWDDTTRES